MKASLSQGLTLLTTGLVGELGFGTLFINKNREFLKCMSLSYLFVLFKNLVSYSHLNHIFTEWKYSLKCKCELRQEDSDSGCQEIEDDLLSPRQDLEHFTSLAWTLSEYVMTCQSGLTHTALLAALYSSLQSLLPGEALPDPDMYRLLIFPSVFPPSLDQDFDISTWSPSPSLSSASPCPLKTSATSSYWCGSWEQSGSIMDTWQRHRGHSSVWLALIRQTPRTTVITKWKILP